MTPAQSERVGRVAKTLLAAETLEHLGGLELTCTPLEVELGFHAATVELRAVKHDGDDVTVQARIDYVTLGVEWWRRDYPCESFVLLEGDERPVIL